jgi:enamine deaminase RidA (YjgF/YER057c/UK114 family)
MGAQIDAALASLTDLLAAAGMTMDDVVRITAYVTDMDEYLRARRTMPQCAYTLIGVSRLAYPDLMVELEAIAAR